MAADRITGLGMLRALSLTLRILLWITVAFCLVVMLCLISAFVFPKSAVELRAMSILPLVAALAPYALFTLGLPIWLFVMVRVQFPQAGWRMVRTILGCIVPLFSYVVPWFVLRRIEVDAASGSRNLRRLVDAFWVLHVLGSASGIFLYLFVLYLAFGEELDRHVPVHVAVVTAVVSIGAGLGILMVQRLSSIVAAQATRRHHAEIF